MIGDISKCAGPIWDMLEPRDEKTDHDFNFWKHLCSVAKNRRTRTAPILRTVKEKYSTKALSSCMAVHWTPLLTSRVSTHCYIHGFRNQGLFEEEDDPK